MTSSRRSFVLRSLALGLAAGWLPVGLLPARARAQPEGNGSKALPPLPLSVQVALRGDESVASAAWVARQAAEAKRLMSPHGVVVELAHQGSLPEDHAALEDARDRDALASFVQPKVINVFVVGSLRDVDDPDKLRMGVRWRLRRDLRKDYVILAASALKTTLAHELGHFFGNGHSKVTNNVMSYRRDDPDAVAFDARQGAKMRRVAAQLLARGRLAPHRPPRDEGDRG